jgi:hypothetical protein
MKRIILTDANYGTEVQVRADHITACTIVSETTYRDGKIPDGVWRRTLVYTIGGSQFAVRETPEQIWNMLIPQSAGATAPPKEGK